MRRPRRDARVLGLAEIVLRVTDLERMTAFYRDVVGFEVVHDEPGIVFLKVAKSDTPLGRGTHPQLFALVDRHRALDQGRSTFDHAAFEIPRAAFARERRRLAKLGLAVDIRTFGWSYARALFFNDPEGNRLEFICHDAHVGDPSRRRA